MLRLVGELAPNALPLNLPERSSVVYDRRGGWTLVSSNGYSSAVRISDYRCLLA